MFGYNSNASTLKTFWIYLFFFSLSPLSSASRTRTFPHVCQMGDEDCILPSKLQAALQEVLESREEMLEHCSEDRKEGQRAYICLNRRTYCTKAMSFKLSFALFLFLWNDSYLFFLLYAQRRLTHHTVNFRQTADKQDTTWLMHNICLEHFFFLFLNSRSATRWQELKLANGKQDKRPPKPIVTIGLKQIRFSQHMHRWFSWQNWRPKPTDGKLAIFIIKLDKHLHLWC